MAGYVRECPAAPTPLKKRTGMLQPQTGHAEERRCKEVKISLPASPKRCHHARETCFFSSSFPVCHTSSSWRRLTVKCVKVSKILQTNVPRSSRSMRAKRSSESNKRAQSNSWKFSIWRPVFSSTAVRRSKRHGRADTQRQAQMYGGATSERQARADHPLCPLSSPGPLAVFTPCEDSQKSYTQSKCIRNAHLSYNRKSGDLESASLETSFLPVQPPGC